MIARILTMALAAFFLGANIESVALAGGSFDVTIKESEAPGAPDSQTLTLYRASRALVIGIDDYENWPPRSNAIRDAEAVAAALKERGFEVTFRANLDTVALRRAFEEFFLIEGAERDARLFVWFSGRAVLGAAAYFEGRLLAVDAPPRRPRRFRHCRSSTSTSWQMSPHPGTYSRFSMRAWWSAICGPNLRLLPGPHLPTGFVFPGVRTSVRAAPEKPCPTTDHSERRFCGRSRASLVPTQTTTAI